MIRTGTTATYNNSAFDLLNLGFVCIGLDLSSGNNSFDLSLLDDPVHWCGNLPEDIDDEIRDRLEPIEFSIPRFPIRRGRIRIGQVRLNHMAKDSATLSWSAAHGGSILLDVHFESAGRELLGTFHGEINNGHLLVYLVPSIAANGRLYASVQTSFHANINIIGLASALEKRVRRRILQETAKAAKNALQPHAVDLVVMALTNLSQGELPVPSEEAVYTKLEIGNGQATISWAESVRFADIVIDSVSPRNAGPAQRLMLQLSAGWVGGAVATVSRVAGPNEQMALPLGLSDVLLPDGKPLGVKITMSSIEFEQGPPKIKLLGQIESTFSSPDYGAGAHSGSNGSLTAHYNIAVT